MSTDNKYWADATERGTRPELSSFSYSVRTVKDAYQAYRSILPLLSKWWCCTDQPFCTALARFKSTLDDSSKEETFQTLKGLIKTISLVEGYTLGPPLKHPMARNQGWDIGTFHMSCFMGSLDWEAVALLADFHDLETYNEYRQHETHLQYVPRSYSMVCEINGSLGWWRFFRE